MRFSVGWQKQNHSGIQANGQGILDVTSPKAGKLDMT
jgi:hypothetical protein